VRCEQARQLFDAFLDGELSPALETELGAHRLRCANCRRELALLEVTGHVLRSDEVEPTSGDFTDRLMRCVEERRPPLSIRLRRSLYIAGPLAAAAVVALAFLGVFDGKRASKVAGVQQLNPNPTVRQASPAPAATAAPVEQPDVAFEEWLRQAGENVEAGRQSGESLQHMLDDTFSNVLKLLEDAAAKDSAPATAPASPQAKKKDDVEDL